MLMFLAFIKDLRPQSLGQGIKESMDDFLLEDEEVSASVTTIRMPSSHPVAPLPCTSP